MILGIDPGKKGGLAFLSSDGLICRLLPMPDFYNFPDLTDVKRCFVERCQPMPGQGVTSMFNYGRHFGEILGLLFSLKIPHVLVTPRKWQTAMLGKFARGDSKNQALAKASQLWPGTSFVPERCRKTHDGIVDAALIAEYGRLYA